MLVAYLVEPVAIIYIPWSGWGPSGNCTSEISSSTYLPDVRPTNFHVSSFVGSESLSWIHFPWITYTDVYGQYQFLKGTNDFHD